ncbi:oligosaccharide repeat unit polymerase family protein [Enterobacter mori]|uniref:O-antigen polymerase n=1 Tax=Enterobacter mori TaxID=539813 RepID=UPI0021B123BE|nr:O-antigen polymerase [Enterobacter mori]MCT6663643.1 oligosaccharide repeat unit polymerase family protein [Enterobacter mori]
MRILSNCYFIVCIALFFSFLLYCFQFSGIYPDVSGILLLFILGSCGVFLFMGCVMNPVIRTWFRNSKNAIANEQNNFRFSYKPIIMIVLFFVVEVLYNGKIPLVEMIRGNLYDYRDFTFPGVHVIFTSLTTFYCIKSYFDYLIYRKKRSFIASTVCLCLFMLLMYRSYIVFCILNFLFLFVLYRKISFKKIAKITASALLLMYVFGLAGDLRTKAQTGDENFTVENIMRATEADSVFTLQQSLSPLYWAYLYISSPMANFQNTINEYENHREESGGLKFVVYEVLPDVVGKRVATLFGYDEENSPLARVIDFLTVGTIFADSFVFIGWYGPIIMLMLMIATPLFFLQMCTKDSFFYVQFSICTILLVLCTFSNMLVYASLSLMLFYPLLSKKRRKNTQLINSGMK